MGKEKRAPAEEYPLELFMIRLREPQSLAHIKLA